MKYGLVLALAVVAAVAAWFWSRSTQTPPARMPPSIGAPAAAPSAPLGTPAPALPTVGAPPSGAAEVKRDPALPPALGDATATVVRDHRALSPEDQAAIADDPRPPAPVRGEHLVKSEYTAALQVEARKRLQPCFDDIPAAARGAKPRANVYFTLAIAGGQMRVTATQATFSDLDEAYRPAVAACAERAIGTTVPAPGEPDTATYQFAMGYLIR